MNFITSSVLHEYLYSPKSWLHQQRNIAKIYFIFISLVYLPYTQTRQIYFYLLFFLFIYRSLYIPTKLNNYFRIIIFIFIFVNLINIQSQQQISTNIIPRRKYLKIYSLKHLFLLYIKENDRAYSFNKYHYLPVSLVRLLSINFLHLTFMKILLLTTTYKNIVEVFSLNIKNEYLVFQKLFFEIQSGIQFLQIIFKQVEVIKIAQTVRSIKLKKKISFKEKISLYFFCLQQLFVNLYNSTYDASNTLYSCEINKKNVNVLYKIQQL